MPILPPRPRNQDCQGTIVPMQGTCAASHWSETGFTVSGAEVVSMMSTLFWVISCWATWAARESLDWLSAVKISTVYFFPPMVRPLANASRTFFSTNGFAVANAASGPVTGLMKPILMVPVLVELSALEAAAAGGQAEPGRARHPADEGAAAQPGTTRGPWPAARRHRCDSRL